MDKYNILSGVKIVRDGNMLCAIRHDFVNLQVSHAGFGETPEQAVMDLLKVEGENTDKDKHAIMIDVEDFLIDYEKAKGE